ncbi:MAG: hypothetical protein LBT16_09115 [Treponema sp.]|jgi:hypothetical protein|nr:hypothetical protein [Treponema sp.]
MCYRALCFLSFVLAFGVPSPFSLAAQGSDRPLGNQAADPPDLLPVYIENFLRAADKAEVLRVAARDKGAADFIGQFYDFVLEYSIDNADTLRDDPDFIRLTVLAVQGMGNTEYLMGVNTLWTVFGSFRNTDIRVETVKSLVSLGKKSPLHAAWITQNLNSFVETRHELHSSNTPVDYRVLAACIEALAETGDGLSFQILFGVLMTEYPDPIGPITEEALEALPDDNGYLLEVIRRKGDGEKLAAFRIGINNRVLSAYNKGEIAEAALEAYLESENAEIASMGYEAVNVIGKIKWERAAPLAIRHYHQVKDGYTKNSVPKARYLEAIACLGALKNDKTGAVLGIQLGYLNLEMEQNRKYDEEITLETVKALGRLGDWNTYDTLLYTGSLPYPQTIKHEALEALKGIKW